MAWPTGLDGCKQWHTCAPVAYNDNARSAQSSNGLAYLACPAMGIYDRDYQRGGYNRAPGFHLGGSLTLTTKLVLVMFGVYAVQLLTRGQPPNEGWFTDLFSLHANLVKQPWRFFELLTYGFLHDAWVFQHIIFNMIALWFFGRSVEYRYGRQEFLAFFLAAIIVSGTMWTLGEYIVNRHLTPAQALGASGGIAAVLILFCLNFPHQMIYVYGVLPIPAWVFAILFVGQDLLGASGRPIGGEKNIAFTAHLGGAVFGFLYYQWGWRLERFLPSGAWLEHLRPKPKLRVVDPDSPDSPDDSTTRMKISSSGTRSRANDSTGSSRAASADRKARGSAPGASTTRCSGLAALAAAGRPAPAWTSPPSRVTPTTPGRFSSRARVRTT